MELKIWKHFTTTKQDVYACYFLYSSIARNSGVFEIIEYVQHI